MQVPNAEEVDVNIVGSSSGLGLYPKISAQKTYNMYVTGDEDQKWLVNYPGFQKISEIVPDGKGRGLFNSIRGKFLIVIINQEVYRLNADLTPNLIGSLTTLTGDVYVDENLSSQICIVDGQNAYIYNYETNPVTLFIQPLWIDPPTNSKTFFPSYVSYHNTFFLFGSSPRSENSSAWYAFDFDSFTTIKFNSQFALQTKPDVALAVERIPGKGNNVLVLGSTVAEVWTQIGGAENYRRVQSFNIDNGLVAISTLASSDEMICWLAKNENNSPGIMVTDGGGSKKISTDGIDHILDQLIHPEQSTAFFYRQDGHLFYQLTFYNPTDNLTLIYDFTSAQFYHGSDEDLDYHPALQLALFNEKAYFTSINDGSLYAMDSTYLTYNYNLDPNTPGQEIPRIRICKTIRKKNSDRFRVGSFTFPIEQGVNRYYLGNPIIPRIDMSFSKNDGQSYSNIVGRELNTAANFRNQLRYWNLGQSNSFIFQLRFIGFNRFVVADGTAEIY